MSVEFEQVSRIEDKLDRIIELLEEQNKPFVSPIDPGFAPDQQRPNYGEATTESIPGAILMGGTQ